MGSMPRYSRFVARQLLVRYATPDQPWCRSLFRPRTTGTVAAAFASKRSPVVPLIIATSKYWFADNGSTASDAVALLDQLIAPRSPSLRVYRYPGDFHFGRINNLVAQRRRRTGVVPQQRYRAAERRLAGRNGWTDFPPEVRVVGARLLFPDGKVQRAGLTLGLAPLKTPFLIPARRRVILDACAEWRRMLSAVSASCMLIRKPLLTIASRFDEHYNVTLRRC